jgi:hypothetical protein
MFDASVEKPCLDCQTPVTFPEPGDATCPACGLPMFLTKDGKVGRYPRADWEPGGIQGRSLRHR